MTPSLAGFRILIVDDEEDLRNILSEGFEQFGATVLTAKNGRDAYDLVKREMPDVILSDVRMPGGDGVELLKRVREICTTTRPHFFLLSGFSDLAPEQVEVLGIQGLVSKPFSLKQLRQQVIDLLVKPNA